MPTLHQMGHDSVNLIDDQHLDKKYSGAILSPINYTEEKISKQIQTYKSKPGFELIFDPQLYVAQHSRDTLKEWSYFPKEIESADLSSLDWWEKVNSKILSTLDNLKPHAVCTPAPIPRTYSIDYYDKMVQVGNSLNEKAKPLGVDTLQTYLVSMDFLLEKRHVMEMASVASRIAGDRIYLIFVTDVEPRRELNDATALKGAMRLIHEMKTAGLNVTVAFSSTDILLWKLAGAHSCATGKFFNLRRFTKSRFNEPEEGGGGQLPYWIEESVLAFLRSADVIRLEKAGKIDFSKSPNPFNDTIRSCIAAGKPWLAHAWRHYMWWFADVEERMNQDLKLGSKLLVEAEKNWLELEDKNVLLDEARNNGQWIRPWRQALGDYSTW